MCNMGSVVSDDGNQDVEEVEEERRRCKQKAEERVKQCQAVLCFFVCLSL